MWPTPDDKRRVCLLKDVFLRVDVLLLSGVHNVLLLDALQSKSCVLVFQLHLRNSREELVEETTQRDTGKVCQNVTLASFFILFPM